MFKKMLGWVVVFFVLNLAFVACTSVQGPQVNPTPSDELLDETKVVNFSFQNTYEGRCVENANSFMKEFCDNDSDGLLNYQEAKYDTDIYNADSDNDGYIDYEEVERHYNPLGYDDLVPEKYKYCERSSQVWCWKAQAKYKADPSVCDNLLCNAGEENCRIYMNRDRAYNDCVSVAQDERDYINLELAVANWDYSACETIVNSEIKEECQNELAFVLGALNASKEYCVQTFGFSKILKDEDVSHGKEMQHRCWFAAAVATEDKEMCADLDSHVIKDFDSVACVTKIARLKNDPSICDYLSEIGLSGAVSRCLGETGLPSEDK